MAVLADLSGLLLWIRRLVLSPAFLAVLSFCFLAGGIIAPFLLTGNIHHAVRLPGSTNPRDLVVLTAAAAAIAGFLFTAAVKFFADARDRAFNFLLTGQNSKEFLGALSHIARFFRCNPALRDHDALRRLLQSENPEDRACLEHHLIRHVRIAGNHFEEMALAIKAREANNELLEDFYAGILVRFYEQAHPVFERSRSNEFRRAPEVFRNVDWLYSRWSRRYHQFAEDLGNSRRRTERRELWLLVVAMALLVVLIERLA